ncbi:hypothetical protein MASR2M78_36200 [Treponema sp.]
MRSSGPTQSLALMSVAFFLAAASLVAQEPSVNVIPAFRERAVVLDIVARVVERGEAEVWNSENSKVTIPGRPVSLKLVGQNVIVVVQFTPYKRDDGKQVLVAQGQVWVNTKDEGMRYQTTMQTIPLDFGERVYFFPLGPQTGDGNARIEIQLELRPYKSENPQGEGKDAAAKDAATSKDLAPPKEGSTPKDVPIQKDPAQSKESPTKPGAAGGGDKRSE